MAKNESVNIPQGDWTEITDSDVTSITVMHSWGSRIYLQRGTSTKLTSSHVNAMPIDQGGGFLNETLDDLFPGASGARVWAYSEGTGRLFVSHA